MRKSIALITLILAILIFVAGCDDSWLNFDSPDEQEDVAEIYVLAEKQSVDKNGEDDGYVLYEYDADGQLIKVHRWSKKPEKISSDLNYNIKPDKNKTSESTLSYDENGVLRRAETQAWKSGSWTTTSIEGYNENGFISRRESHASRHKTVHTYEYSYDDQNRVIKKIEKVDSNIHEFLYEYSESGLLIKETDSYLLYGKTLYDVTETKYNYSEDGALIEKDEIVTTYETSFGKTKTTEKHRNYKYSYEWSDDRTVCIKSNFSDDKLSTQEELTYDSDGNILKEKYIYGYMVGSYTEYVYEWLPDHYNKIKNLRKK